MDPRTKASFLGVSRSSSMETEISPVSSRKRIRELNSSNTSEEASIGSNERKELDREISVETKRAKHRYSTSPGYKSDDEEGWLDRPVSYRREGRGEVKRDSV